MSLTGQRLLTARACRLIRASSPWPSRWCAATTRSWPTCRLGCLSGTLIVRDLTAARALAVHLPGHRFVTLHGELLEADGTLTVGTHHAETGILSRKSELRELREQVANLDRRLAELDRDLVDLREATGAAR